MVADTVRTWVDGWVLSRGAAAPEAKHVRGAAATVTAPLAEFVYRP